MDGMGWDWDGMGMGWKSLRGVILRAPLCGANKIVEHLSHTGQNQILDECNFSK